jgi:hypothetical protein
LLGLPGPVDEFQRHPCPGTRHGHESNRHGHPAAPWPLRRTRARRL